MQVVIVSSPGDGRQVHWSHAFAAELAGICAGTVGDVSWLAAARRGQCLPPPPPGVERRETFTVPARPLHHVDRDCADASLEATLTAALRERPAARVVHVGAGARGSPNVVWIAERMGSPAFAVVRAAEVVCHRGDLRQADGEVCTDALSAERCRTCCTTSWWRRPPADALPNRADLLIGGFVVADAVFTEDAAAVALLQRFGVPAPRLAIGRDAAAIAARVLAPRAQPAGG